MRDLLVSLMIFVAMPVAAQPYAPPEGCTLEMTVQLASCRVAQHYRCAADAPGDQWVAYFTESGGPVHVSRIDAETRWMETSDPQTGLTEMLAEEPDAASLSTLLAEGHDDYDFWTRSSDGLHLRYQGFDRLTGETVRVDGVELLVTEFHVATTAEDGTLVYTREGGQFVSPAHRRFYGGREEWVDWTGATGISDDTPRAFARPGQPGFGSLTPLFGCRLQVSSLR